MKRFKKQIWTILQNLGFGILIIVSIAIMALVIWINLNRWLR
jgi:hypothetical protein